MPIDPLFIHANYVEACFWIVLGIVTWIKQPRRAGALLAVALLAFGISDLVETRTGAWYRPWWLLAWKTAFVAAILASGIILWKKKR